MPELFLDIEAEAIALVRGFCAAWDRLDMNDVAAHLADDILYCNGPLDPLRGRTAVEAYLRSVGPFQDCHWEIVAIAATGTTVLTERIDRFTVRGRKIALPVMGAFEISAGRITVWRDYFDLASYRAQGQQGA